METSEMIELQIKAIKNEILSCVGDNQEKMRQMQIQLDALDSKIADRIGGGGAAPVTIEALLRENESFERLLTDKKGVGIIRIPTAMFERKTLIDSGAVGSSTSGVLQIDRIPGIVPEARQELLVRNVLTARPTTQQIIDFVRVVTPMTQASPQQGEGHSKLENLQVYETVSERVRTLATWIPCSKQVLEDWTELAGFISTSLRFAVETAEELQLLSGSGSGQDLHGLATQSADFDTDLLPLSGHNRIDQIGYAIQQITSAAEVSPSFIVLHPVDWWAIRLTKDGNSKYILGDPMGPVSQQQLFGLTPVVTTNISSGTFLIGSGRADASEIRDRLETVVEVSTQHSDYFTRNLVAVRAEKRLALIVKRPASYVSGSFSTSP